MSCVYCSARGGLGFSVEECRQLLSLYHGKDRKSADVKMIAEAKLVEIDRKLAELAGLREMKAVPVEHVFHMMLETCSSCHTRSGSANACELAQAG